MDYGVWRLRTRTDEHGKGYAIGTWEEISVHPYKKARRIMRRRTALATLRHRIFRRTYVIYGLGRPRATWENDGQT